MSDKPNSFVLAKKVAAKVKHISYEDLEKIYNKKEVAGFDPVAILAFVEMIMEMIKQLQAKCEDKQLLFKASRIRNRQQTYRFRQSVFARCRDLKCEEPPVTIAEAFMDVAHSSGEEFIKQVVSEYDFNMN